MSNNGVVPQLNADQRMDTRYLDGLRGLVALYVVLRHSYIEVADGYARVAMTRQVAILDVMTRAGKLSISFFVVLSGFLLMLPLAIKGRDRINDLPRYFRRRFARIYPPYLAALVVSLLMMSLIPPLNRRDGHHWDITLPSITPGAILSHLFLVHNWFHAWAYKIGHPLWSIATEVQLYVLFPLVLLPLWRKIGVIGLAIPLVLVVAWQYIARATNLNDLHDSRLWYVGHFALGMIGAMICFSKEARWTKIRQSWPWTIILLIGLVLTYPAEQFFGKNHVWVTELCVGLSMLAVIVDLTRYRLAGQVDRLRLMPVFESRVACWLGKVSYSLFLMHAPMVALARLTLIHVGVHDGWLIISLLVLGPIYSLAMAVVFYHLVEHWFTHPMATPNRPTSPPTTMTLVHA